MNMKICVDRKCNNCFILGLKDHGYCCNCMEQVFEQLMDLSIQKKSPANIAKRKNKAKTVNKRNKNERREVSRISYSSLARYRIQGRPDLNDWNVNTENISSKGILVFGKPELPVGRGIEIILKLPFITSRKIVLHGQPIRIAFSEKHRDKKHVGIKFSDHMFIEKINNYVNNIDFKEEE